MNQSVQKIITLILLATSLVGCGTAGLKDRKQIRNLLAKNQIDKAVEVLEKSEIKKDAKSSILYFMEKGRLEYARGDYFYAAELFAKAKVKIKEFYTKSITQKIAASVLSDKLENYYGEIFEVSMLHYYLAKSYFQIYLTGQTSSLDIKTKKRVFTSLAKNKRKQYLFSARAEVLAWDSYFKDVQRSGKKTIFKSDLIIKLFGAAIHEAVGSRSDAQIALQLYKDAKKVLYSVSNILETYNGDYKKYTEDRVKNLKKNVSTMPKKHFKPTAYQNTLKNYIDSKIVVLTNRLRKNDLKKIIKREKISKEIAKNKSRSNVTIFLEDGLISEKKAKVINLGLESAMDSVEDPTTRTFIKAVGIPVITYFAMNTLKLVPQKRAMTYGEFVYSRNISEIAVRGAAVEFEIPMVEKPKDPQAVEFEIYKTQGKEEVLVKKMPAAIIAPLGDTARQNLEETAADRFLRKGIRVAIKHIVAIIAAYKIHKNMKKKSGAFLASTFAIASYLAASKGILATERADLRYWSTLPQNIRVANFKLEAGEYILKTKSSKGNSRAIGSFIVDKAKKMNIFSYSSLNL